MRLQLEATPAELREKREQLIRALMEQVAPFDSELADSLEKALPPKKVALRFRPLRELHEKTTIEYERTLTRMIDAIHKVITRAGKNPSHEIMSKAGQQGGPFIGPRGGKWADPQHTIPWEEPGDASHNGVYRYGATLRPVSHANVPKGSTHEPHEAFRHGQAVYDRPLTAEEIQSYELTPILNDRATEQRVARALDDLHEYAAEYRDLLKEDPRTVEVTVRQALERQGPGHFDMDAAVKRVLDGLQQQDEQSPQQQPQQDPRASIWADPKQGDELSINLNAAQFGEGPPVSYYVAKVSGDKVQITRGKDQVGAKLVFGPMMTKAALKHFVNDLEGRVDLPQSGNKDIDAVISGQAQFLGKGDDGLAFKVGDKVVKASTTVPYQPDNPEHRTPEQAADMLKKQVALGNKLVDLGITGVQRSEFVKHGDKGFQIKPYVDIPATFTREQLDDVQDTLIAIHKAGYAVHDDIQAGIGADGKPVMFDVGKAGKIPEGEDREGIYGSVTSDMSNLKRLYEKSGQEFVRRDYSAGQKAVDRVQQNYEKWMASNPGMAARHTEQALNTRAKELKATLKGKELDQALDDLDLDLWAARMELGDKGFPLPTFGPAEERAKSKEESAAKSLYEESDLRKDLNTPQAGPYIGPRGGKWADPEHTIPWKEHTGRAPAAPEEQPAPVQAATPEQAPVQQQVEQEAPPQPPTSLGSIKEQHQQLSLPEQQKRYFLDRNTGLLNARGVDAQPHDPNRPMTARFSMEGFKAFNDRFGHEIPDGALRVMANTLSQFMHDGVKRGGDIEGDVRDQSHADKIADAMSRAIDPQGRLKIVATAVQRQKDHAATLEALGTAHRAKKDAMVASGQLGHRLQLPVAFAGEQDPNAAMQPLANAMHAAQAGQNAKLSTHHRKEFKKVGHEKAFETAHVETTGLLTDDGFARSLEQHPDHHVASADMRGLQAINDAFGREAADAILKEFSTLIAQNGGGQFNAAHPHGDEYLAHAPDPEQLRAFFSDLKSATDNVAFILPKKSGQNVEYVLQHGLNFVHGVGRDLDEADRIDLAKNKEAQGDIPPPRTLNETDADREVESLRSQGVRLVYLGAGSSGGVRRSEGEAGGGDSAAPAGKPATTEIEPKAVRQLKGKIAVDENGRRFETGKPVTFTFSRNLNKAPKVPRGGEDRFQQKIEPAGRYMQSVGDATKALPNGIVGKITFNKPIVIQENTVPGGRIYDENSWKANLSAAYGGKKGKALSQAIAKDGYDGVVTVGKHGTGEIVDLRFLHTGVMEKSGQDADLEKAQGGPYIGPRGGKWADPEHTIHWEEGMGHENVQALPEEAHPAVKDEVVQAAIRAVAVGADAATMTYVGAGGEAIIFTDKTGRAYRVLRTGEPQQRKEKVQIEQEAVDSLKGTPAEKYIPEHFHADPQHGVIVRAMAQGRPGGWGTKGLREAYDAIAEELRKQDFSAPEYKEDSFVVPEEGGDPLMVDLGFMYYRGKRQAAGMKSKLDAGDATTIDLLSDPFEIRNLYSDEDLSLDDAIKMTAQIKALRGEWADYKNHVQSLESTAKDKGELAPDAHLNFEGEKQATPKKPRKPRKKKTEAEEIRARVMRDGYQGNKLGDKMDLSQAEEAIRHEPIEHCAAFDAEGRMLFRVLGTESAAQILPAQGKMLNDNGNATFTHNHPTGNCFSPEDVLLAVSLNLKEMRAAGSHGTFVLTRPAAGWLSGLNNDVIEFRNPDPNRIGMVSAHAWMKDVLSALAEGSAAASARMDKHLTDADPNIPRGTDHPAFSYEVFYGFASIENFRALRKACTEKLGWGLTWEAPNTHEGKGADRGDQSRREEFSAIQAQRQGPDWGPVDEKEKKAIEAYQKKKKGATFTLDPNAPVKKPRPKRTPVKAKGKPEDAPLPGQRGLFNPEKVVPEAPSQLALFGGKDPTPESEPPKKGEAPLPGQQRLFKATNL